MTEYSHLNGANHHQNGHKTTDLEDSILSLVSTSDSTIVDKPLHLKTSYRKAAKLFINKKFYGSFKIIDSLLDLNVRLFAESRIEEEVYVSVWSLYFNLIDIFINKETKALSNSETHELERLFFSNELFEKLYSVNEITPPKLVLLLLLIKLNNSKTDFIELRQQLDLYLIHASRVFNEENTDYLELLEIYHVHLLLKLNQIEESEFLIRSNSHIRDPEAMVERLKQNKLKIEEEEKKKKELEKQKRLKQKKREQKLKEQRLSKPQKKPQESSPSQELIPQSSSSKEASIDKSDLATVLDLIKKKFWFLNKSSSFIVLALLALTVFSQNRLIFNRRVRQQLGELWTKVTTTLQMAFKVTYV